MSGNVGDHPKPTSPQRPRHQITRSITELSSPIRLHKHNHSRSHHHQHKSHGNHSKDHTRDERVVVPQSAAPVLEGRKSAEVQRPEGVTPNNLSSNPSRRTSILIAPGEDNGIDSISMQARKIPTEDQARLERQRAAARTSGLQKCLADLGTFSNDTTRRLDDTYYSVLEKLGALQSTVIALKELAVMSRQMNDTFHKESQDLVSEIGTQLQGFGQFEDQENRILSLQNRIHSGRDKIRTLSERVDLVRGRVEGWERADREWQERTRKRLRLIWIITSILFFLLLILFVSAQYVPVGAVEETAVKFANESLSLLKSGGFGENATGTETSIGVLPQYTLLQNHRNATGDAEAEERLRLLDEL